MQLKPIRVLSFAFLGLLFLLILLTGKSVCAAQAIETGRAIQTAIITTGGAYFVSPTGNDANPGTSDRPWATINHAAEQVVAGDVVLVRGGRYLLLHQVRPRNSGRSDAFITFIGDPREAAVLDAQNIQQLPYSQRKLNDGAFQIEGVSHIRVVNLTVINSHDAGFTVRDSNDIELINNTTNGTYSSGIAVWNTNHVDKGTERIRILGNTIVHATSQTFATDDVPPGGQTPHEALSVGGAIDFEVAYNHIYDSDKEGIDIKETSKHGKVHHNVVESVTRQGIYVDAWFGELRDITIVSNIVHDCRGAGFAISAENGKSVDQISFSNNLVFDNGGSGFYFSRWGVDNLRKNILITDNIFSHNGYGPVAPGQRYHWQIGGIYLYSTNVENLTVKDNIFSENRGFQIGYSELFLHDGRTWASAVRKQRIRIVHNLIDDRDRFTFPILSGGNADYRVNIYRVDGDHAVYGDASFENSSDGDFTLKRKSPAIKAHLLAGPSTGSSSTWWKQNFPPRLFRLSER
jgi:Right handed beta helix region